MVPSSPKFKGYETDATVSVLPLSPKNHYKCDYSPVVLHEINHICNGFTQASAALPKHSWSFPVAVSLNRSFKEGFLKRNEEPNLNSAEVNLGYLFLLETLY